MSLRDQIVDHLRQYGPMTGPELSLQLGLSYQHTARALMWARHDRLIAVGGKDGRALVYSAVQTREWPARVA